MRLSPASYIKRLQAAARVIKGDPVLFGVSSFDELLAGPEDKVISAKGVDGYWEMYWTDAEVSSSVDTGIHLALPGISVVPGGNDAADKRNADIITAILDDMTGSTLDAFAYGLKNSAITGFSVIEPVYKNAMLPGIGTVVGLEGCYTRPSESFADGVVNGIEVDKYGKITLFRQSGEYGGNEATPEQVVYYAHNGGPDQRFGSSMLRPVHEAWAAKLKTRRVYQVFMVTNASGLRHLELPAEAWDNPTKRAAAQAALEKMGSLASFTTGPGWKMNITEPGSGTGGHFREMLDMLNAEIRRGILGDSSFSGQEDKAGSYASRGISQDNVRTKFHTLGRSYCEAVAEQLFPMILRMNGYTSGRVPLLQPIGILSGEDARAAALASLSELRTSGVLTKDLPEQTQLELLNSVLQPMDVELESFSMVKTESGSDEAGTVEVPADASVQSTALNGAQVTALLEIANACAAKNLPLETAIAIATASFPAVSAEVIGNIFKPLDSFALPESVAALERKQRHLRAKDSPAYKRAQKQAAEIEAEIVQRSTDLAQTWTAITPDITANLYGKLFEQRQGGGWKTTSLVDVRQIVTESVRFKSAEIRKSLTAAFEAAHDLGQKHAKAVLGVKAAAGRKTGWTPAQARAALQNRVMLLLDDKYSTLAAQLYYAIENALVGDLAIPVAQQTIMSIFGFSPFGEQYAATILDTAMATAWNTARMQSYAELENVAGTSSVDIVGYQFLAVLDEHTTEQCAALHDEYFKADDPSLPRPPLHFNCRSQLVPVFGDQRDGVNWMTPEQSRAQVSGMVAAGQIQKGFGGV